MPNILEVKNLKKYFPIRKGVFYKKVGDVKAVDNISFSIAKGEIFGLVGESGCGKSTTGRTILKLLEPTGGSVRFKDQTLFDVKAGTELDGASLRALRKDMQMIFQDPFASLDPRWTIGNIVTEGMLKHGLYDKCQALEKAQELLVQCGLDHSCINKYPHEFSGGQRQRISIARSIALNPDFIIGDELIAALDVSIQAQILLLLQSLIEQMNLTFLFISHDLHVMRYFCHRVVVMYLGSIVEQGTSSNLFGRPLHPYTQALLQAMPASRPSERGNKIIIGGEVPSPANPPSGCKFHPRCAHATAKCKEQAPQWLEVDSGHYVACHLYTK